MLRLRCMNGKVAKPCEDYEEQWKSITVSLMTLIANMDKQRETNTGFCLHNKKTTGEKNCTTTLCSKLCISLHHSPSRNDTMYRFSKFFLFCDRVKLTIKKSIIILVRCGADVEDGRRTHRLILELFREI